MVYVLPWKRESWQRALEARRLWASAASMAGRLAGKSRAWGKKGLQSERGSRVSGTKVGHLAKAKRLGVTTVCARKCSRVLSLNGSVLQKVSDVLKVEERKRDNSQLKPKAGGKCGNERCRLAT